MARHPYFFLELLSVSTLSELADLTLSSDPQEKRKDKDRFGCGLWSGFVLFVCFGGVLVFFGFTLIIKLIITPNRMLMFEICFLNLAFYFCFSKKKCFQVK